MNTGVRRMPASEPQTAWRSVRRLATRQFTVGLGIVGARLAGFATGAMTARALGPGGFASYTVAFTIFTALMQAMSFADTWLISRWGNVATRPAVGHTVWRLKAGAYALLLMAAAGVALARPAVLARFDITGPILLVAVAAAAAGSLTAAVTSRFQAEGRFTRYSIILGAGPVLGASASGILLLAGVRDPFPYVLAFALAYFPIGALAYPLLRAGRIREGSHLTGEALRFGGWITVGTLAYVVYQRLDVLLLSGMRSGPEVGFYGAAVRFSMVGSLFANTLVAVLTPAGSRRETWEGQAGRSEYLRECATGIGITMLGIGILLAFAPWLLATVFGATYLGATPAFRILLLGQAALAIQMPFYFALYAFQRGRWIAAIGIVQLAVAWSLGYLATARYGATGAAWSNTITYLVGALAVAIFHWHLWRTRAR